MTIRIDCTLMRLISLAMFLAATTTPVVIADPGSTEQIVETSPVRDIVPAEQLVSRPEIQYDEEVDEYFFDLHLADYNLRATLVPNDPGLVRITHPTEGGEFWIRVTSVGDPEAGTAIQFLTVLDQDRIARGTVVISHDLVEDQNGDLVGAELLVESPAAGTAAAVWYDAEDLTFRPFAIQPSSTVLIQPELPGGNDVEASIWGWVQAGIAAILTPIGVASTAAVVSVGVAVAGARSGLFGPYNCDGAWNQHWNGCVQ